MNTENETTEKDKIWIIVRVERTWLTNSQVVWIIIIILYISNAHVSTLRGAQGALLSPVNGDLSILHTSVPTSNRTLPAHRSVPHRCCLNPAQRYMYGMETRVPCTSPIWNICQPSSSWPFLSTDVSLYIIISTTPGAQSPEVVQWSLVTCSVGYWVYHL